MRPEYAPNGLIGLLTPQANTTVEPEFSVLMPDGVAWLNGRLTSTKATIRERLIDYMDNLGESCHQFGNAPLEAVALGCTGTGYFVGPKVEDQILKDVSQALGVPSFSAASAVVDGLHALGARSIVLLSPYEGDVDTACSAYWADRGFDIKAKLKATGESGFHPIYALRSQDGDRALATIGTDGVDAIVILGTGMPTLATLLRLHSQFNIPVLSCMLCLGWRAAGALESTELEPERLQAWARGDQWSARLERFTRP